MPLNIMSHLKQQGYHVLVGLIILLLGFIIARYTRHRVREFLREHTSNPTIKLFVVNVIYSILLIVVVIMTLNQFGVPTTSLLTVLGATSLAIALSIKDSLANIASGLLVIALQPFRIGDVVEIDSVAGIVDQINLFTTRIKTANNERIYVPNALVMKSKINNKAYKGQRRLALDVGIGYDSDIKAARAILITLIQADARVLVTPEPSVVVSQLGDSAVIITARLWMKKEDYAAIKCDLLENLKQAFDEAGIAIPYPQREITLTNASKTIAQG